MYATTTDPRDNTVTYHDGLSTARILAHSTFELTDVARYVASHHSALIPRQLSPHELVSAELTFPRFILSEFNTHRVFSRNSASSRAIPVARQIRKILTEPFVPARFGVNEPGMQASAFLEGDEHDEATRLWLRGRDRAVLTALELLLGERELALLLGSNYVGDIDRSGLPVDLILAGLNQFTDYIQRAREAGEVQTRYLNVHKQSANRVLEPYAYHTVIVSTTELANWTALRTHRDAQPEIQVVANLLAAALDSSTATVLADGERHLPLLTTAERREVDWSDAESVRFWSWVSTGRCAAVSYEFQGRVNPPADEDRALRLVAAGHMSPTEHVAWPWRSTVEIPARLRSNFSGYIQLRKTLPHEADYGRALAAASA